MVVTPKHNQPDDIRITAEIPCVGCGHLLVGQFPTGVCPECAQPVRWSMYGSSLSAADGDWLRKRLFGATLAIAALPWVWIPFAWIAIIIGVWAITTPNPARQGRDRVGIWFLRTMMLLAYGVLAVESAYLSTIMPLTSSDAISLGLAAYVVAQIALTVAIWRIVSEDTSSRLVRWLILAVRPGIPSLIVCVTAMAIYSFVTSIIASGGAVPRALTKAMEDFGPLVVGVCAILGAISVPCFWVMLAIARRRLDQAIVRSDDIRQRVRAWNPWTLPAAPAR